MAMDYFSSGMRYREMNIKSLIGFVSFLIVIGLAYLYLGSSIIIPVLGEVNLFIILGVSSVAGIVGLIYSLVASTPEHD